MTTMPSDAAAALLIIDAINALDFDGSDRLLRAAEKIVDPIVRLRGWFDAAQMPVIYVNDHQGNWRADRQEIVANVLGSDSPGRAMSAALKPRDDDLFVIKPQLSGFYATTLPALLPRKGVQRLVLTGLAADICVLFTAGDAHMREYKLWIPADAVAGEHDERTRWALEIMRNSFGAETCPTTELSLEQWLNTD